MTEESPKRKADKPDRFVRCEKCGAVLDNLNTQQILDHERPLPHVEAAPKH